jgi:hypothetical protein
VLGEAFRYPLADATARDAFAAGTGAVLVALILVRVGAALWPSPLAVVPAAAVVVPASLFVGYLGRVLRAAPTDDPAAFDWSVAALRGGVGLLAVAAVYLLPALVAVVATAFVVLEAGGGSLLTVAPTVALLVTVAAVYVLPAALAASTHGGVRAGLSRASLRGLASGSYFFAWTVATSLVVVAWSALTATRAATIAAVLGVVGFVYAHVVAARLLGEGLARSPWEPAVRSRSGRGQPSEPP